MRWNYKGIERIRIIVDGQEPNPITLDQCSGIEDITTSFIKPQWCMDCDELTQRSLDAVFKDMTLTISPKRTKQDDNDQKYYHGQKDNSELSEL